MIMLADNYDTHNCISYDEVAWLQVPVFIYLLSPCWTVSISSLIFTLALWPTLSPLQWLVDASWTTCQVWSGKDCFYCRCSHLTEKSAMSSQKWKHTCLSVTSRLFPVSDIYTTRLWLLYLSQYVDVRICLRDSETYTNIHIFITTCQTICQ